MLGLCCLGFPPMISGVVLMFLLICLTCFWFGNSGTIFVSVMCIPRALSCLRSLAQGFFLFAFVFCLCFLNVFIPGGVVAFLGASGELGAS